MYAKDENSVLFSLSNLRTLAMAPGSGVNYPHFPGEATKMLDIRRFTPDFAANGRSTASPALLMGPQRIAEFKKWIIPLCIGFGTLIICIIILSLGLIYHEPATRQVPKVSSLKFDQPSSSAPSRYPTAIVQPIQKAHQTPQSINRAAEKPVTATPLVVKPTTEKPTTEKPLSSVNDLKVEKRTARQVKTSKNSTKKRAYRKWNRKKIALLKHRRARQRRAKTTKQNRTRLATRSAGAKKNSAAHVKKRRGSNKSSELDDLLTGL